MFQLPPWTWVEEFEDDSSTYFYLLTAKHQRYNFVTANATLLYWAARYQIKGIEAQGNAMTEKADRKSIEDKSDLGALLRIITTHLVA